MKNFWNKNGQDALNMAAAEPVSWEAMGARPEKSTDERGQKISRRLGVQGVRLELLQSTASTGQCSRTVDFACTIC